MRDFSIDKPKSAKQSSDAVFGIPSQNEAFDRLRNESKGNGDGDFLGRFRKNDTEDYVFAQADISEERTRELEGQEKTTLRRKIVAGIAVLAVVFVFSGCISVDLYEVYSPLDVFKAIGKWFELNIVYRFTGQTTPTSIEIMEQLPNYYQTMSRFGVSFITLFCGILLAVAGTLYQMVFRNPIAAPTMLGVSNGVSLGILVLVLQFAYSAPYMVARRYLYCYLGAVAVLLFVLFVSKLASGKGRFSIVELLLVGSMTSQILGALISYIMDIFMDEDLWLVYQEINEMLDVDTGPVPYVSLVVAGLAALVPIFAIRYSANLLSYSDEEAHLAGVDPTALQVICLVCGTVMVITAQIHIGAVSLISLTVPFISRAIFGSEFRKQLWGDLIIGAILLLVCRDIVGLIPFVGEGIPLSVVVCFVTLPVYVCLLASKQRGWQ